MKTNQAPTWTQFRSEMIGPRTNHILVGCTVVRRGRGKRMNDPHAVRWATRPLKRMMSFQFTKWHWTEDAQLTVCGQPIIIGREGCPLFPETNGLIDFVNCKRCLDIMGLEVSE